MRKEIPAAVVHVLEDVVDQLHSLRSVVEDASMVSRVVVVIGILEGYVVLIELTNSNRFFWFYAFLFEKIIEK